MMEEKIKKYVPLEYQKQRTFYHVQYRFKEAREAFYREVQKHKPESILDVGCGTGPDAPYIIGQGVRYVGVDPIEDNLKLARQANPGADFRQGFVQELNFPDKSFDWVWMTGVWELLPTVEDMVLGMRECLRVARTRVYNLDTFAQPRYMAERYMSVPMEMGLTIKRVHYCEELKKANYMWIIDLEVIG